MMIRQYKKAYAPRIRIKSYPLILKSIRTIIQMMRKGDGYWEIILSGSYFVSFSEMTKFTSKPKC